MHSELPLTVFFDASCGLCRREMQNIAAHDGDGRLRLVDCSAPGFDDAPYQADDITRADMMARLHVRDSRGAWVAGPPAFELLYRAVGMRRVARLWGWRALMGRLYPWIARHRRGLSLTGLPLLFGLWSKCTARRDGKRGGGCPSGHCSI